MTYQLLNDYKVFGTTPGNAIFSFDAAQESYQLGILNGDNDDKKTVFAYRSIETDFIFHADIESHSAGLMLRYDESEQSPYMLIIQNQDNSLTIEQREVSGGEITTKIITLKAKTLQIERSKGLITLKASEKADYFQIVFEYTPIETKTLLVGIAVQTVNQQISSTFSNVRLYIPAKEGFIPYTDYIGSILEIIEISTGKRKVVFTSPNCIEAPNWTHDGLHLIVNSKGFLYSINIENGEQKLINTGFATKNNNDHGISPDGKQLVISHHAQEKPHNESSTLYILPIEVGTPVQVTQNSPSYWHGWSPDGQWLYYTANRNNKWNIFKIKVEGGEEIQLTDNEFLDDGSDCSPDGKYVWFNSNRTGVMQIWRMKTDGSGQVQITHDERQNWFAHPSPDNTKIVYLSYPPEVNFWDHPYYKHVYLCLMDIDGQNMQVLAPLYGGQGTINVPSWSPDSRYVAFVSHTDM